MFRSSSARLIACVRFVFAAFVVACSSPVQASERDFPFTYDWLQAFKGEREIALHSRYRARGRVFTQLVEFEYGLTDRFMLAPYVEFERAGSGRVRYEAAKLEARYQFGTYQFGRVLPGLYLEYEQPRAGKGEIEAKIILSRYDKQGGDLSLNLILARELEASANYEKGLSFGYVRPLGSATSRARVRGGFEYLQDFEGGRINAGPVVSFSPSSNSRIVAGYAAALNRRDDNKDEFRLVAEYHWF